VAPGSGSLFCGGWRARAPAGGVTADRLAIGAAALALLVALTGLTNGGADDAVGEHPVAGLGLDRRAVARTGQGTVNRSRPALAAYAAPACVTLSGG
jgi:hypothetical protein